MSWMNVYDAGLYAAAGMMLGAIYFLLLGRTIRMHASGMNAFRVIPLYGLRVAGAVAGFWMIAQQGALPLLAALMGFVVARVAVQRAIGLR